jgi:hypothetical protein
MKRTCCGVVLALTLCGATAAHAQSETKTAVAEGLYRQARELMAAGNYDAACPKLAESQRLDPATGTLLNLAACHEKQGKLATAWLEYSDALVAARRDGRDDRVDYARQRAAELEPKLSRLTIVLAPDADEPELTLELDGASVGRAVLGAATPVDPGTHVVRATAPGKKPWQQSIEIGAVADQQSLTVPRLEIAPVPEAGPAPTVPAAASAPGSQAPAASPTSPERDHLPRPIPTSVYVSGGITLGLLAGAGITGLVYQNKKRDHDDLAGREGSDSDAVQQRKDSALRWGYANMGMWIGTAVGASVTTYLFVTRPARPQTARLVPWAGPGSAGLSVTGGF